MIFQFTTIAVGIDKTANNAPVETANIDGNTFVPQRLSGGIDVAYIEAQDGRILTPLFFA